MYQNLSSLLALKMETKKCVFLVSIATRSGSPPPGMLTDLIHSPPLVNMDMRWAPCSTTYALPVMYTLIPWAPCSIFIPNVWRYCPSALNTCMRLLPLSVTYICSLLSNATSHGPLNWPFPLLREPILQEHCSPVVSTCSLLLQVSHT